jgi:hypothetical protein
MDSLEVGKFIVVGIDTDTEEQPSIPAVDDLRTTPELNEIRLIFLISGSDKAMNLGGGRWLARTLGGTAVRVMGDAERTSPFSLTFSSSCSEC